MRLLEFGFAVLLLLLATASTRAAEADDVVLDGYGSWRMFQVLKPPEIALDEGVKTVAYPKNPYWDPYYLNGESPLAPAGWSKPEFDDGDWLRGPVAMQARAAFVARTYLRGRFVVTDPSQVKSLQFSVRYHGGAVVHLNGEEIGRGHLAAGAGVAEAYPAEAFLAPDGALLVPEGRMVIVDGKEAKGKKPDAETLRRVALRARTLDVELPARLLHTGVNVLAVEIIRAPYHKVVDDQKTLLHGRQDLPLYNLQWNTCEVLAARLTATGPRASAFGAAWPAGLQVWNSPVLRSDFKLDTPALGETVRPITLTAARNGIFSGKVVVGSAKPIRGLKAIASDLRGTGGVIPASALRVRYAVAGGTEAEYGIYDSSFGAGSAATREPAKAEAIGCLLDAPPEEYPVARIAAAPAKADVAADGRRAVVPGAVAPVWLTVKVPVDAKPGLYEGQLAIRCEGEKAVEVPVRLEVADWTLADPEKYRTWVEVIQSPDTLQLEYGVPAWSDKHFELIARSFRLMREVGSGVLYLPLICATNYGNEESIVRWVKKGEKQYDFDYTMLDKYLDVAEKNLGKPKVVCFVVWDVFLLTSKDQSTGYSHGSMLGVINEIKNRPTEPSVTLTVADPATGKLARATFPNEYFNDDEIKSHWRRLFGELRARMKKRGLEDAMALGWFTDYRARKQEIAFWNEVTGDLPWVSHGHFTVEKIGGAKGLGFKVAYETSIHDVGYPVDPASGRKYGWRNPLLQAQQLCRPTFRSELTMFPGTVWNSITELTMAGGQRGFGRVGGDNWLVLKDKKGNRAFRAYERYPWNNWINLEMRQSMFAPGPEGAVATARFEQLRDGVEACEARVCIEQALSDEIKRKKLGAELANRCQAALDERLLYGLRGVSNFAMTPHYYNAPWSWIFQTGEAGHAWFQSTGWQERNAKLFALAGEVERKLAVK